MKAKYTDEKNVQMLLYILKKNNIRRIIASPGTTNISFVASIQNDDFFEVYSCVDERSACYMACGLAAETKEPVVLTCTGATASRNYIPGLTEAYYRKLPVLAVTAAQHFSRMGAYSPQCLDRSNTLKDIVNLSVQVPSVHSADDEIGCNILLNQAVLELTRNGGGPVHINIETTSEGLKNFNTNELPTTRVIERIEYTSELPTIPQKSKIGIFVGAHLAWDADLTKSVDEFCEKYNACVICDHTSNYLGKYKILGNLLFDQDNPNTPTGLFDLLIHLGSVSGAYMDIHPKTVWRVNPDGEFRDVFKKVTKVFQLDEADFFKKYNSLTKQKTNLTVYASLKAELVKLQEQASNITFPLSNIFVAQNTIQKLPNHSVVHFAILNSLRSWNFFDTPNDISFYCNTGGFGIDGPMSTLIGASLASPNKLHFGVIGDLAFFYDLNSLGNRNIKNNLRIILINNGRGTEFHNYTHPASALGDSFTSQYISAGEHFGNKSSRLVKNYTEDLGFEYLSASNKTEVINQIDYFVASKEYDKPIIFEIFTNSQDESDALKAIRNLSFSLNGYIVKNAKKVLGQNTKNKIKKILGR